MHGECIVPHDTFPPPSFKFRANFPPIKSGNNATGSRKFDSCVLRDTRISFPETRFANKSPLFPRWRVLYLATSRIELAKGASINDVRARGGEGGSGKADNSTDKLRDHVCDRGGGGPKIRNFHGRH